MALVEFCRGDVFILVAILVVAHGHRLNLKTSNLGPSSQEAFNEYRRELRDAVKTMNSATESPHAGVGDSRSEEAEQFRIQQRMKLDLWQRGIEPCGNTGCASGLEPLASGLLGARWLASQHASPLRLRGGASADATLDMPAVDFEALRKELGPEFSAALDQNEIDHKADCEASCEHFYCGKTGAPVPAHAASLAAGARSFTLGSLPPEDFAPNFHFPLDLIKVTSEPLIPPEEAESVVAMATEDGVYDHEFPSGKYRLGGDWIKKLPRTLEWFNKRLESTLFPTIAKLFPEVVSDASVLRAHSVAILKYNSSHPRTDVHVDDGILAMTLALSPKANYTGGGTYYEHMRDKVLPMDQGFATLRPGSVRHGGHPVTEGDRYILGGFLLLEDRVEHVRRLVERGSEARRNNDLITARRMFKWALAINPKCARCLKNWGEAIYSGTGDDARRLAAAEDKLRRALDLLPEDSDGWYSLGLVLGDKGDTEAALDAYNHSFNINSDDHELCYNMAVLYANKGEYDQEIHFLKKSLEAKPDFGKAWSNLGVAYASSGDLDSAEKPFLEASRHDPLDWKSWFNLAKLHSAKGRTELANDAMGRANELKASGGQGQQTRNNF